MDIKQLIEAEIGCELTEQHLELYRKEVIENEFPHTRKNDRNAGGMWRN